MSNATPAQILEWSDGIEQEIGEALDKGTLISSRGDVATWENVRSWGDLHAYCDANEFLIDYQDRPAPYGNPMFADENGDQSQAQVDAESDAVNAVTVRLDDWLKDCARERGQITPEEIDAYVSEMLAARPSMPVLWLTERAGEYFGADQGDELARYVAKVFAAYERAAAAQADALTRYRAAKDAIEATRDGGDTDDEIDAYRDALAAADLIISQLTAGAQA